MKWKRRFMEAEHMRRKYVNRWEADQREFSRTIAECETTISMLESELKHTRIMHSTQRKMIEHMKKALAKNGIEIKRTMVSISNCKARDDEMCPLSLVPINSSPLPVGSDTTPCPLVLNQAKPNRKCAELACGHRFNSLWLIHHFVERSTFRCPVCHKGEEDFNFQKTELPPGVVQMLKRVAELKRC